jgi:2'-5' RNA ligase
MRINKNKLTSASKYHVTLLVLRIQNTAEYKELLGILQQAETIFRKYFDDQKIELQLKQVNDVTNNNQVTLSSENILNEDIESDENDDEEDGEEDENSSEEQDEESEEDDDDDSENGEQGEDLEKIKTELKVTEKPVLRFQNVGHFYGSGKCIVWIGLKDDAHKIMLEHLARILYMHSLISIHYPSSLLSSLTLISDELFKHVKKSNPSFLIEGASSRFHPHVTLYKNKIEKSAKEVKGKSPMTPKKLANFCTKYADVDFGEQSLDKIIINVKTGREGEKSI